MNKKLIAVAIAATMAAPLSALAEVEVGARMQVELVGLDDGVSDGVMQGDVPEGSNYSALWFQASEKLGNGWTAFGKLNFNFDPSQDTSGVGRRDAFLGMKNDLLSVSAGRINGAYKKASVQYDPFLATSLQARTNGGMTGGSFGHSNYLEDVVEFALNFDTGMGTIGGNLQYSFDEDERFTTFSAPTPTTGTNANTEQSSTIEEGTYAWNVKWSLDIFEVFGAGSHAETPTNDFDNYKIGGKVTFGDAMIAAQYENAEMGLLTAGSQSSGGFDSNDEADIFLLTGSYKLGNITLAGWASDYDHDNTGDGNAWSLGALYNFSKRTRLHAGYRETDIDADGGGSLTDEEAWVLNLTKDEKTKTG